MYNILKHSHSGLRWIVIILIIYSIFIAFKKSKKGKYSEADKKIFSFSMIFTHIQILLGGLLMFFSDKVQYVSGFMKSSVLRFYGLEHILSMVIAVSLLTVAYSKFKKSKKLPKDYKKVFYFFLISLLIILASIPWPFRNLGGSWF